MVWLRERHNGVPGVPGVELMGVPKKIDDAEDASR
jgi:hypothetical protein